MNLTNKLIGLAHNYRVSNILHLFIFASVLIMKRRFLANWFCRHSKACAQARRDRTVPKLCVKNGSAPYGAWSHTELGLKIVFGRLCKRRLCQQTFARPENAIRREDSLDFWGALLRSPNNKHCLVNTVNRQCRRFRAEEYLLFATKQLWIKWKNF